MMPAEGTTMPATTTPAPAVPATPAPKPMEKKPTAMAPAFITINVPADAKVRVNGLPTTLSSAQRKFASPELEPNEKYYYMFTAEVVRDGQLLTATEVVIVEAGKRTELTLKPAPAPAVASK
jgi:uncharacterized protein (TIGR03000 family)